MGAAKAVSHPCRGAPSGGAIAGYVHNANIYGVQGVNVNIALGRHPVPRSAMERQIAPDGIAISARRAPPARC